MWLEPDPTRIIWFTFLAAMDEDGFAQFAGVPILAHTARVTLEGAHAAVATLEGPDADTSDGTDGRRIERVPGGWMILNAKAYRDIATRENQRDQTRARTRVWRERKASPTVTDPSQPVTGDALVTHSDEKVTPSEAYSEAEADTSKNKSQEANSKPKKDRVATATRLPADFNLTIARRERAVTELLDPERTFERFCNYWRSKPGAGGRKLDWDATWRNWCMTEHDRNKGGSAPQSREQIAEANRKRMTEASWARVKDYAAQVCCGMIPGPHDTPEVYETRVRNWYNSSAPLKGKIGGVVDGLAKKMAVK